jgi:hypothetical protein
VVDDDPQDRQPVLLHLDVHHLHKYIKKPLVCAHKKVLQCGLTAMRHEAEVRRFNGYLVRFDRHEAGSGGEAVNNYTWLGLTAMRQESEVRRFNDFLVKLDRHEAGRRGEEDNYYTWLGLTDKRQAAEVMGFNDYLVMFDRQEAGSRGNGV